MGERRKFVFEPSFNRAIKVRAGNESLSSDAGFLLLREVDERLHLVSELAPLLIDPRDPRKIRYTTTELLRERIYAMAIGYGAQDDLDRLAHDPAAKSAVWDRPGARVATERLASQPTQSRLIDRLVNPPANLEHLRDALARWVLHHQRANVPDRKARSGTLDIDGFPVEIRGKQEGAEYNGYFGKIVYYPLVASFAAEGDYDSRRLGDGVIHARLRRGNALGEEGCPKFILEAVQKAHDLGLHVDVRVDAAFTKAPIPDALTDAGCRFLGRLASNPVLERMADPYLTRPPGRPPSEGYEFAVDVGEYAADSWRHKQRIVLVVIDKPDPRTGQLTLEPKHFFLVTNWPRDQRSAWDLLAHYRRRGTFEDRFAEFNAAISPHLSMPRFVENDATLLLALLAFNLVGILRREIEDGSHAGWDLGRLQKTVLKAGARVARRGRRLLFDLAEAVSPLWDLLVRKIRRWKVPEPAPKRPRFWMPPPEHAHLSLVLRC